ncbi:hypothetical protein Hanom_Chr14g01306771 [Helianthus anomalus]
MTCRRAGVVPSQLQGLHLQLQEARSSWWWCGGACSCSYKELIRVKGCIYNFKVVRRCLFLFFLVRGS